MATTNEPKLEI